MDQGMRYCYSENGVLLTPGFDGIIPPEFLEGITERATGRYWQNPAFLRPRQRPNPDDIDDDRLWVDRNFHYVEPPRDGTWAPSEGPRQAGDEYVFMTNTVEAGSRPPSRTPSNGPGGAGRSDASWQLPTPQDLEALTPEPHQQLVEMLFWRDPWA